MNGVAVEPSSHLARNPTYTSRTRAWDLASSPSTAITKYHCTLTFRSMVNLTKWLADVLPSNEAGSGGSGRPFPLQVPDLPTSNLEDFVTQSVCIFDPRFSLSGVCHLRHVRGRGEKRGTCQHGSILAVGGNDGTISCVNADDGTISFVLDATQQPPEFHSEAGVFHMAFYTEW
ncbi:hypothetical protein OS493_027818 [Desmophyllum pertusum]|uniref:Uncharacterized protein n=1 Tax=Desmophyllum pertusum TaxID=174260 RepID=A0A9X0CPQ9_9CNID|nr:hypothetical protein OS493_027818 [Desmophyllum pertusum]